MNENASPAVPENNRRGFLTKALAVVIGGLAGLVPAVAGIAVFLDPLRKRKRRGKGSQTGGPEGFLKVAVLDGLPIDEPRRFTVIDDLVDAWNLFPDEPVGVVYLVRTGKQAVTALNADCPHAGCRVDFSPDRDVYQCPCHNSSFKPLGEIANSRSPSARGLDSLEVDPGKLKDGEVWVKFQSFRSGTPEKIAEA